MIFAGDFNVKFSLQEFETLLTFLKDQFRLEMITGRNDPIKGKTTIDAVLQGIFKKYNKRYVY